MSPDTKKRASTVPPRSAPLSKTLDRSERVQGDVKRAGVGLSSVNAALKAEVAGVPLQKKVEGALKQSKVIEANVQGAAAELVAVNAALADEIVERRHLEDELSRSNAALASSRAGERRARASALHDAVTGLPNLTLFNDRLRTALVQAQRHGWRLGVMFIDLDDFKGVNDTHGHDVGDRLLQLLAERLQGDVRRSDTVCRRSGDEFLFLMLEPDDETSVAIFAAKIAASVARPFDLGGFDLTIEASIGIAVYPEDGASASDLLRNADVAMYAAKERKSGPVLYSSVRDRRSTV